MISLNNEDFKVLTLDKGKVLFKKGQKCTSAYIVRSGYLACFSLTSDKRVIPIFSVKDSGLVGEDNIFSKDKTFQYNSVALEKTVVLKIPLKDIMTYVDSAGDWMKNILFDLSEKVSNTSELIVEHKLVDERLNNNVLFTDGEQKTLLEAVR